jgi:hypothetical protein
MTRGVALLLLLALLVACATVSPVEPQSLAAVRSVWIVSVVGDPVHFEGGGGAVPREVPAAGWDIDAAVAERVATLLRPRFEVLPARYERTGFVGPTGAAPVGTRGQTPPFAETLRRAMAGQPADAYVVLLPAAGPYGGVGAHVIGLGVLRRSDILGTVYELHTTYTIWLVDGRDFRPLGAAKSPNLDYSVTRDFGPARAVDETWWPSDGVTDEQGRGSPPP